MPAVNFNATAQRMAGGTTGGMPGMISQIPWLKPKTPATNGYGNAYGGTQKPGMDGSRMLSKKYKPDALARNMYDTLYDRGRYTQKREVDANASYDAALDNPMKQAQMFQGFYGDATQAMAAPIMRQFQEALAANVGSAGARFGGVRGSTEEAKGEFATSDVFSRNLGEITRANAGQAVNAGMDYTGMLGNRAAQAGQTVENNTSMQSQVAAQTKKPKGGLGGAIGGLVGGAIGSFAGGFGTGIGAKLGSKLGGG